METMREDDPQHYWNLGQFIHSWTWISPFFLIYGFLPSDGINTWLTNADLGYALAVLIMDVLLAAVCKLLG
jgi:hypothetical protein